MSKVVELSQGEDRFRFDIIQSVVQNLRPDIEFEYIVTEPGEKFEQAFKSVLADRSMDNLRLSGFCQAAALSLREQTILEIRHIGVADAMIRNLKVVGRRDLDGWWPRNYMSAALRHQLSAQTYHIDISAAAIIFGTNSLARSVVAGLALSGMRQFLIADVDDAEAMKFVKDVSRLNFGLEVKAIPFLEVTQLPSSCSVAINCFSTIDREASTEIAFFNFLRAGGLWIDFGMNSNRVLFEDELRSIQSNILSAGLIWSRADVDWTKESLGLDLDQNDIFEKYQSIINNFGLSSS
jgi:hypothetical protein